MKNIYILSDTQVEHAKNIPLIETKLIESKIDIDKYDALIFTSKKGVIHLNQLLGQKWKKIPSYAISKQTAKEIQNHNGNLVFTGEKQHGDKFAHELIKLLQRKKVAYIGAKKVVSDLHNILNNNGVNCDHIAVYETICVEYEQKLDLPDNSIIIFSSPSTIKCFLKNAIWKDSFQAISIGHTTKKYFPNYIKPIVADDTSLKSCVQKALSL